MVPRDGHRSREFQPVYDTLEVARREVEQHEPAVLQMALCKVLLDRLLALKQPIHRRVEGVLVGIGDAEVLAERRVGPGPRDAELARLRRDDALRHHRHD
jgi:hypothetical protein